MTSNNEEGTAVSGISIIGTGHMARILGTLAVEGGNAVEVTGRDPAKAAALARALGRGCCCCGRPSGAGTRP